LGPARQPRGAARRRSGGDRAARPSPPQVTPDRRSPRHVPWVELDLCTCRAGRESNWPLRGVSWPGFRRSRSRTRRSWPPVTAP
jgi:hypothetical protein